LRQPARTSAPYDARYLEIVSRLRAARKSSGISQAALAERLGKPQSFVSKIETCERRMDLLEALELCRALGVDIVTIVPAELRLAISATEKPSRKGSSRVRKGNGKGHAG
jgi:transcriptional regulator with XRE-family HTH domain